MPVQNITAMPVQFNTIYARCQHLIVNKVHMCSEHISKRYPWNQSVSCSDPARYLSLPYRVPVVHFVPHNPCIFSPSEGSCNDVWKSEMKWSLPQTYDASNNLMLMLCYIDQWQHTTIKDSRLCRVARKSLPYYLSMLIKEQLSIYRGLKGWSDRNSLSKFLLRLTCVY